MNGLAAIFYRDYLHRTSNLGFVFWDLLAPLAYLLLFGLGFQSMLGAGSATAVQAPSGYTAFLLPGVLAMVTFSIAINTSWGFFVDRESGIFYELLSYPITRQQILIGKITFNVLLSLLSTTIVILVGALALGVPVRWDSLPLTALIIAVTNAGWCFLWSTVALSLRKMDLFNTITSAAYVLLMFFSSLFYPLAPLPAWYRVIAYCNPMTWQVDLLRYSLLGVGQSGHLWLECVAMIVVGAGAFVLAARALSRAS
jgi:ABC-2 type transport system permease protein